MVKGSVGRCRSRWFWADVDLSVVGHDGKGVYGSVTAGITGASTMGTVIGTQREPPGHLEQKIGMSTSLGRMTAPAPQLDLSSWMHTHHGSGSGSGSGSGMGA